jgi:hypothetical protein
VASSLLGPFADEIVSAPTVPAHAPVVCTVEILVSGPGEYDTPACTLSAPGFYVWVEKIDPARTPADQGGSRMRPWQSAFGVASEVTHVTAPAPPAAPAALAATGLELDLGGAAWAAGTALAAGTAAVVLGTRRRRLGVS